MENRKLENKKTYDTCYFLNYNQCNELQLYEIGEQQCPPDYSYGPVVRNHYIFHYIFEGTGILYLNDQQYSVSAGQGFVILPNILAYYQADTKTPWHYAWVHLDGPKAAEVFRQSGMSVEQPVFYPASPSDATASIMQELLEKSSRELYCIGKIYELFDNILQYSAHTVRTSYDAKLIYI